MGSESFFTMMCGGMIALLFGLIVCFSGYRLFLVLIPFYAFFFGFGLGAQTVQAIFGEAFLATITSWVVGFIVALVFAVLSYLFYIAAVAIVSFSLGYSAAIGLLTALGLPLLGGIVAWLVAVVVGVALALVVLRFNIQKIVIQLATAVIGAGGIVGVFVAVTNPTATKLMDNPVQFTLANSPFWLIVFLVLAGLGFVAQWRNDRRFEVQTYNRLENPA